jgi:hypothetical protein
VAWQSICHPQHTGLPAMLFHHAVPKFLCYMRSAADSPAFQLSVAANTSGVKRLETCCVDRNKKALIWLPLQRSFKQTDVEKSCWEVPTLMNSIGKWQRLICITSCQWVRTYGVSLEHIHFHSNPSVPQYWYWLAFNVPFTHINPLKTNHICFI